MASSFSSQDLAFIHERGSKIEDVTLQIEHFRTGFPFLKVKKAATVGDGILRLSQEQVEELAALFESDIPQMKVMKFVPASGAASRMFKSLFSFVGSFSGKSAEEQKAGLQADRHVRQVIEQIEMFAFFNDLEAVFPAPGLAATLAAGNYAMVLDVLLSSEGLGYGELPKGLLKFHRYASGVRTPMEEHLVEAAHYTSMDQVPAHLHFTISPEHRSRFEALVQEVKPQYEATYGITFDISFSEQKPATDTIAVDMDNEPFREADGTLLFRPAGHGALIENLNDLDADVIFIKNIDNVVPDRLKQPTYLYKKALGALLLDYQAQVAEYLEELKSEVADEDLIDEVDSFLQTELGVLPPDEYYDWSETDRVAYLRKKLDRPIRVCGMVKNEGEPGGGPVWAASADGSVALQIAESAQIDMEDPNQVTMLQSATHFNPVDLVIWPKNTQGEKFDLPRFRDPMTGFISGKSKDGRDLKAQELPGLWNGAMSDWITIFVEVPIETFNPVKTVNDLLREQHQ